MCTLLLTSLQDQVKQSLKSGCAATSAFVQLSSFLLRSLVDQALKFLKETKPDEKQLREFHGDVRAAFLRSRT